jgi:hypothetical protein
VGVLEVEKEVSDISKHPNVQTSRYRNVEVSKCRGVENRVVEVIEIRYSH